MASTNELCETLAASLGIEREAVVAHADHLREAGMLPDGDAPVDSQHCAALLLGLMSATRPERSPEGARLYGELLFEGVTRSELMPDGTFETIPLADDDPFVEGMRAGGETFGEFLQSYIVAFNEIPKMDNAPSGISVGGGAGNAFASIQSRVLGDGVDVGGSVQFGLTPYGGGRHPDDAPLARLDNYNTVPGSIFGVFRDLFAGDSEGPREVIIPRAKVRQGSHDGHRGPAQEGQVDRSCSR